MLKQLNKLRIEVNFMWLIDFFDINKFATLQKGVSTS